MWFNQKFCSVKNITVLILVLLLPVLSFSQSKQANQWVFGKKVGVDFNTTPPDIFWSEILTQEGCASIAGTDGELKFYTDGVSVWNANHEYMEGGNNTLKGHFSSTQSGIIVPRPDTPDIYYIFTVPYQGGDDGLMYSTIDMSENGGLGKVIDRNVPLVTPVDEKVTAVTHYNGEDIWVITHEWQTYTVQGIDTIFYPSKKFHSFLVTADGVNEESVVSEVGIAHGGNELNTVGYMKGSPDGERLALALYHDEIYQLFDFDSETGEVSYPITFPNYKRAYGIEFSPNSRILYMSKEDSLDPNVMHIYQVDLFAGSPEEIIASQNHIGEVTNNAAIGRGAIQVGPDQKIYIPNLKQ